MPKLVPLQSISLIRDNKPLIPTLGVPFDFTDDEANFLTKNAPDSVRKPVNEEPAVAADADAPKAKGGKKADPEL